MLIFAHKSTLDIIHQKIRQNEAIKGYKSLLAKTAGCHVSHFSQVLGERAVLSADQAISLCVYWEFTELETDYFLTLLNLEKASNPLLRQKLEKDLNKIRVKNITAYSAAGPRENTLLSPTDAFFYVNHWSSIAVHWGLMLEGMQTVRAISEKFQIPPGKVQDILLRLEKMNLVEHEGSDWKFANHARLPDMGPSLKKSLYQQLRQRAVEKFDSKTDRDFIFSSYFAITRAESKLIQRTLKDCIDSIHSDLRKSTNRGVEEELVSLCIDYFSL